MSEVSRARLSITESDAQLAAVVEAVSPLLLALAAVHMSGSLDVLQGIRSGRPTFAGDVSGALSEEDAALVRRRVLPILKAYRDAGNPAPYAPTEAELHRMLQFVTGIELPENYLPMILEDMALFEPDPREFRWTRPVDDAVKTQYPVVIIGAGVSGMLIGLRLKQAGLPFIILEKNASVGGTWFENQYPGLRVDVPSHVYSFSFIQDHPWPNLYSHQSELLAYFRTCADRFGIAQHIRYGMEVSEAAWDEDAARWTVSVRRPDGLLETLQAKAVVSAVGFLNRPNTPSFAGARDFKGPQFHTAMWQHDVSLAGKRVAFIGNAATGLQAIPEIAKIAAQLTIFQRSPSWTVVMPECSREIEAAEQWALDHLPGYSNWMRAAAFNWSMDFSPDHIKVDPGWPQDGRSTSMMNDYLRRMWTETYERHLEGRPDLLQKLLPDYPPFVKRPTLGNGDYFKAMKRDNVELVSEPIDHLTEAGVVDKTGRLHEADVVIYATGFKVQQFLTPMIIRGRGGITLNDYWADRPGGYLGIVVPQFPNFFMMYGPGTNLGYNGSALFCAELQTRFIAHCLRLLVEEKRAALEVKQETFDDYMDRTGAKLAEFVWSTSYGSSYFRNEKGRVTTNSPWSLIELWEWTQGPDPAHFLRE